MRDEYDGHPQFILQITHERQNLRLCRDVQRSRRLISNQQTGLAGKGHCNHRALTHPAAQLMGITVDGAFRLGHAYLIEDVNCLGAGLLLVYLLVQ